jgi:arylsulfatase A-like enzyme
VLSEEAISLAEVLRGHGYATGGVGAGPWLKSMFGLAQGFDWYDSDTRSLRGRPGEEVNKLAIRFLRKHRDEPFFLFVNYFDAHDPYLPPPDLQFEFFDPALIDQVETDPERALEYKISQYDAEILLVDRHLGVLLEALKDLGVYENTWMMVMSDHGEEFGEHGLERHGFSLFEPEIRGSSSRSPLRV